MPCLMGWASQHSYFCLNCLFDLAFLLLPETVRPPENSRRREEELRRTDGQVEGTTTGDILHLLGALNTCMENNTIHYVQCTAFPNNIISGLNLQIVQTK